MISLVRTSRLQGQWLLMEVGKTGKSRQNEIQLGRSLNVFLAAGDLSEVGPGNDR